MDITSKLLFLRNNILQCVRLIKLYSNPQFKKNRIIGEILRNTHSIEKGLSLSEVRLGFGVRKCREAFKLIEQYIALGGSLNDEALVMYASALKAYLQFHEARNYRDQNIEIVEEIYKKIVSLNIVPSERAAGYLTLNKKTYTTEEVEKFERLFNDRHSIREFDGTPVNENDLKRAIQLAAKCPSACNRQCYRVYVVNNTSFSLLNGWFDGVGGFDKELDKILIITGSTSMYRWTENMQWVVTSSIFAGYLSLTLQLYGIGACVIQRDIYPNSKWNEVKGNLKINDDELPVCCIGIGNLKDEYKVPISNRLSLETIITQID